MITKIFSVAQRGLGAQFVDVETDIVNSLPGLTIVGLPDKAVEEARERIRSAIKNSGFKIPPKRFVINLVPADLPKSGSCFDLPIALAILVASG